MPSMESFTGYSVLPSKLVLLPYLIGHKIFSSWVFLLKYTTHHHISLPYILMATEDYQNSQRKTSRSTPQSLAHESINIIFTLIKCTAHCVLVLSSLYISAILGLFNIWARLVILLLLNTFLHILKAIVHSLNVLHPR
ncbi:hypothetical protein F4805DRAFT_423526 [Annulohypoxylon moriforme]|nr:hypothetical protein F4805DRAFT_423526 [Annulohypoxylon moriforme]